MRGFFMLAAVLLLPALASCDVDRAETNKSANGSTLSLTGEQAIPNRGASGPVMPVYEGHPKPQRYDGSGPQLAAPPPVLPQPQPSYSTNGSYDDNGAEPAPNNGNQNFGRRW